VGGAPGDSRRRCGREDLALALGGGLLLRGVVDLLEDARNRQDEGGGKSAEVRKQVLDVCRVTHAHAGLDADDLDEPREHMGQRQEEQRGRAFGVDHHLHSFSRVLGQSHEVVVGEQASLGQPGRA